MKTIYLEYVFYLMYFLNIVLFKIYILLVCALNTPLGIAMAFDKVYHDISFHHKLNEIGITGEFGGWFFNFLSDRTLGVSWSDFAMVVTRSVLSLDETVMYSLLLMILMIGIIIYKCNFSYC